MPTMEKAMPMVLLESHVLVMAYQALTAIPTGTIAKVPTSSVRGSPSELSTGICERHRQQSLVFVRYVIVVTGRSDAAVTFVFDCVAG